MFQDAFLVRMAQLVLTLVLTLTSVVGGALGLNRNRFILLLVPLATLECGLGWLGAIHLG